VKATDAPTDSSVTHTPGPWHVEPAPSASSMRSIRSADGKAIAFVNRGPNADANAALLNNAPGLLQALRDVRDNKPFCWEHAFEAMALAEGRPATIDDRDQELSAGRRWAETEKQAGGRS
jgi:hypothetical protein